MKITLDMGRTLQGDFPTANNTRDRTANDHIHSSDHTCHLALLTDNHLRALNVPLDLSVDLQDTSAKNLESLPYNLEVVTNHRFVGCCGSIDAERSRDRSAAIGPARLQRLWVW